MNDQNQQQPGQAQSGQTPNSPSQENSLANAGQNKPFNPWEGTPDPGGEQQTGGDSGSGEVQQQSAAGGTEAGKTAEGEGATKEGQQGAVTPPPATTQSLTAADISDLVAKTVGATVAANQPKPEQKFTEEDFRRTFQVFEPTPEILASIGLPATPESAQAFAKITAAIVRQAVTMSAYQLEKLKGDLEAHVKNVVQPYEPARQMAQERVEQKLKDEFLEKNPDLKGYEPLLEEIKDRLISQGTKFKSKDDVFKTIGDHARNILKQMNVAPGANGQNQQTQQSTNATNGGSTHRMSGLSGSGQGGVGTTKGGTGGGAAKKKSQAEQLFG